MLILGDGGPKVAALHVNGDRALAMTKALGYRSSRTTAAPRRECISRTTFPDLDLEVVSAQDTYELDIRSIRKEAVVLYSRAEFASEIRRYGVKDQAAMRVPNRRARNSDCVPSDFNQFVQDLAVGALHGDLGAVEADTAQSNRNRLVGFSDTALDGPSLRSDVEGASVDALRVPEILREDAESVSALFRFGSIWVEDADGEAVRIVPVFRQQNPIRPRSKISMADPADDLW